MEIIKTKKEQEKAERYAAFVDEYSTLLREYPDTKVWRILRTIAEKHGCTPNFVRYILVKKGAYINPKN